jgi:hypothetical protein
MTNGILIKYGDVAVGAREQFEPYSTDSASFVDFEQIKKNILFPNYTNPCELYSTALDGGDLPIPSNAKSANLGWWSEQISDENGVFANPIVLTSTSTDLFISIGITLTFDAENDVYANSVNIKWYRYDELISEKDFSPDSSIYFCANKVEFYNKIVVTFYSINMPFNRLKVHDIEYGYGVEFKGDELQKVKIIQEIDPLSTKIAINPCDFDLISKKNIAFSFQERQPLETYFNGELRAKTFIKDFERKSKSQWSVKTEDYIGIMENVFFYGGIYNDKNAVEVLGEIFAVAKVPFTVDESLSSESVSGHIPYCTCREALMQVCFAIGAVADTSNRADVLIYPLSDELTQTVSANRIIQGQKFTDETRLTAFELTEHKYVPLQTEIELYNSSKSEAGENIFIKFPEPVYDLIIEGGEIVSRGANYAVINASENCVLSGKKYEHIKTIKIKQNPLVSFMDTDNVISIQNATLVSNNNVDKLLEKCYNYFVNRRTTNMKIVEGKHISYSTTKYGAKKYGQFKYGERKANVSYDKIVKVGDVINFATEYSGNIQGRVIKQTYNLNGGIIIKDTVVR